jgi:hypothetical protein
MTSPEIALPELDGKTAKVSRTLVYFLCGGCFGAIAFCG